MAFTKWKKLLRGIQRGECVLFLGPELPVESPGGELVMPPDLLADRLAEKLDGVRPPADTDRLAYLAERLVRDEDRDELEIQIEEWHQQLAGYASPVHDLLAELPFDLVVSTSHDPFLARALAGVQPPKSPRVHHYHYDGPQQGDPPPWKVAAPLLYHLYGHVDEPRSVVVTQTQLLEFLTALISKTPPLPYVLNEALTNGTSFLFLGFGLRRWHLRILLHVLRVLRHKDRPSAFAIELGDPAAPAAGSVLFFRESYRLEVEHTDVVAFVRELHHRYEPPLEGREVDGATHRADEDAPTVFISHASNDKVKAAEVATHLEGHFQPILDSELLAGGDRWDPKLEAAIHSADFFVLLVSEALHAKADDDSYVNKEIVLALERQRRHLRKKFIVPVSIDDSPKLAELAGIQEVDLVGGGMRELVRALKRK